MTELSDPLGCPAKQASVAFRISVALGPSRGDFQAKDAGSIAVALVYTAHLVSMISFFLQVPLRYPIILRDLSTVKDNINDKLKRRERGEKWLFDYSVYLLNKNIAQLRYQHGLGTPDLRQTLPNLKNFMEHGLVVRCDRNHTSSATPVPKIQSPIFGGADVGFSGISLHRTKDTGNGPAQGMRDANTSKENKKKGVDLGDRLHGGQVSVNTSQEQGQALSGSPATVSGTLLSSEQAGSSSTLLPETGVGGDFHPGSEAELCCAMEQAEKFIGVKATAFTSGNQLKAFNCIPVDGARAVECDEQVLGEFEEFSPRIYALNENISSFHWPRRSSDK
ncbi:hypothetical protein EI555_013746 [Monodon monoceros]|uniref:Uncharacterized protein n=1 Tax=Monodon monoceros TaxID=40151 RepID=A0A4U1EQM1_MONMO|nr:hypothetical protein EI555_013746 [Monodon monoceros]